jgi:adenylate kinase family enzyme
VSEPRSARPRHPPRGPRRPDNKPVQRISVVGNSGSGKTTLAAALGRAMGAPHLELVGVFHQPDWEPLEAAEFRRRVSEFIAGDRWVVDGNYSAVRDLIWARADTVVWLDPPRHRVMRQILWRTVRRAAFRKELWNGNRERWANLFTADPQESVVAWAWTRHSVYRERYLAASHDPANAHLTFIRCRSPRDTAALLRRARDLALRSAAQPVDLRDLGRVQGEPGEVEVDGLPPGIT